MKLFAFELKKLFRSAGFRYLCIGLLILNFAVCLFGGIESPSADEQQVHIDGYETNLAYIIRVAEINKAEYEITAGKDSYLVKYQQEVIDRYSTLVGAKAQPVQTQGWNEFFDYSIDDLLLFVFAVLAGTLISMTEWDNGTYTILNVTARGRKSILAKISVLIAVSFAAVLAINLSTISGIALRFGLSSPNADICSVMRFAYCPYNWSILEYLFFTIAVKAISLIGLMLLSAVAAAFFKSYLVPILISFGVVAVGYCLTELQTKSEWVYLNLYAVGLTDPLFERYRAISVMGSPASLLTVVIAVIILLDVALMVVYAFGFRRGVEHTAFARLEKGIKELFHYVKDKLSSIIPQKKPKRRSLLSCEAKKAFIKSHLIILCAVMLLIKIGYANKTKPHIDYAEDYYEELCYSYSGDATEEKRQKIQSVMDESQAVISQMSAKKNAVVNGTITAAEYNAYMEEYQIASLNQFAYERLMQQCMRIDTAAEKGIKAQITYDSGWLYFFSQGIDVVLLAFLLLLFSGIYRMEYQNGFDKIAATTAKGMAALHKNKLLLSLIVSAVAFAVCSGIDMAIAIQSYSFPNAGFTLASVTLTSMPITLWMAFVAKFAIGLTVAVAFSALICVISRFLKRIYLTVPTGLSVIVILMSVQTYIF